MNNIPFYIEKFVYSKKGNIPDLNFVPANTRRKLNDFDKHVIYMLNSCADEDCENIILSSRYGEFRRLFQLLDKHKEFNESSPMMFSASVHNYVLGQFTMLKKENIPTLAISAGEESFINGLVTAITSPQKNIVYCYADDNGDEIFGMCFKISKTGTKENKYMLKYNKSGKNYDFIKAVEFFEGSMKEIVLNNYCIERVI